MLLRPSSRRAGGLAWRLARPAGCTGSSEATLLLAAASPTATAPSPAWAALGLAGMASSRGFAFGRGNSDKDGTFDAHAGPESAANDLLASTSSSASDAGAAISTSTDAITTAIASFDPSLAIAASAAAESAALAAAREGVWVFNSGFQSALVSLQEATGAPWWGAIMGATLIARTLMLPVVARQMRNTRKLAGARPEMLALQEWFKEQQLLLGGGVGMAETAKHPGSQALVAEYQTRLSGVWAKHDCHPVKSLLPLFAQAPLFIGFFSALRSLAEAGVPSLTHGGAAWFPNLAVADPTYGLPLASAALFLATVEAGAADGMQGQDPTTLKRMKLLMRCLAVGLVPLTASMPAGVFVYWATSNAYSLAQALALKTAPVRRLMGVPEPTPGAEGVVGGAAVTPGASASILAGVAPGRPVETFDRPPTGRRRRPGKRERERERKRGE
jgi:YidC/Oxa1 family membrane protein insertase